MLPSVEFDSGLRGGAGRTNRRPRAGGRRARRQRRRDERRNRQRPSDGSPSAPRTPGASARRAEGRQYQRNSSTEFNSPGSLFNFFDCPRHFSVDLCAAFFGVEPSNAARMKIDDSAARSFSFKSLPKPHPKTLCFASNLRHECSARGTRIILVWVLKRKGGHCLLRQEQKSKTKRKMSGVPHHGRCLASVSMNRQFDESFCLHLEQRQRAPTLPKHPFLLASGRCMLLITVKPGRKDSYLILHFATRIN